MDVFDREVREFFLVQPPHPVQFALRRTAVRNTPEPLVPETINPLGLVTDALAAEMAAGQTQQFAGFFRCQTTFFVVLRRSLETLPTKPDGGTCGASGTKSEYTGQLPRFPRNRRERLPRFEFRSYSAFGAAAPGWEISNMGEMFKGAVVAIILGLAACSSTRGPDYRTTDISGNQASTEPLNPGKAILVSIPGDGAYNQRTYPGSGQDVARRTAAAFSRYAQRVEIANLELQGREQLLAAARGARAGYLIAPAIVHWESRATGISLIPSQVDVDLVVVDVETGHEVRSTVLEGRSNGTTTGKESPAEMYSGILDIHTAELYRVKGPAK